MATETLLTRTRDNCVIAFTITFGNEAEKRRLKHECENLCQNLNYRDFNSNMLRSSAITFDADNTNFLRREISGYHYRKDRARFDNGMRDNPPAQANTLSLSYQMDDTFFPEVIKNLGFKIMPNDKVYDMHYNEATGQFEAQNFVKTTATINSGKRELEIVRNHFRFAPNDYRRLQQLQADFVRAKAGNPRLTEYDFARNSLSERRDRTLFGFYAQKKENVDNLSTTIAHELKHVKNAVFDAGLTLKANNKRLSVDNYYRIAVEDERSAYLEELVQNINTYLQRGDYDDFSMFYVNNHEVVTALKRLRTPAERLAYVQNWPQLVADKMQDFEEHHRHTYDYLPDNVRPQEQDNDADGDNKLRQFLQTTKSYVKQAPLNAAEDVDGSEFRKLRSLFYNYRIYNPATHRMETVNLAQYITPALEVNIDNRIRDEIISPQQTRLNARLQEFAAQKARGEINPMLIEPAKSIMRGGACSSAFINEIDNFRIATLYEAEQNAPTPTPTPTPTSDSHADWSNDLQAYWQGVDGYRELAKTDSEYKFKVNDATVRYTSKKDVQVSPNADYDLYVKLLREPSNHDAPVEFLNTLSREQALMLYVACINNGRTMRGAVPTDLSGIENLRGISAVEMNKFRYRTQNDSSRRQQERQKPPAEKSAAGQQHARTMTAKLKREQNTR